MSNISLSNTDYQVYMNTWSNYHSFGNSADETPEGWMSVDTALEYCDNYKDYEPFIADTENVPFTVTEYSNAVTVLNTLKQLQEFDDDARTVIEAIIEASDDKVEDAIDRYDRGDYIFYPDVNNETELAYAVIGDKNLCELPNVADYIDEKKLKDSLRFDVEEQLRKEARDIQRESGISESNFSQEFEDAYISENIDSLLDDEAQNIINDMDTSPCKYDDIIDNTFDYERFGRDIYFSGYHKVKNGYISLQ